MTRGRRFLPDSELMFVALDVRCRHCPDLLLARFAISTSVGVFEHEHRTLRGGDRADEQLVGDHPSGANYFRWRLSCPRCANTPTFRDDRVEEALRAIYEPQAREKIITLTL